MTDAELTATAEARGLRLGRIRWNGQHVFFLERTATGELLRDGDALTRSEVEKFLTTGRKEASDET
jgi:hypothetical protein